MRSILVVDDDADLCSSTLDILELEGFSAVAAGSADEGLRALEGLQEPPCLILLDFRMPGMPVSTFVKTVRADPRFADVAIVGMSGVSRVSAPVADIDGFLHKPVVVEELIAFIASRCPGART